MIQRLLLCVIEILRDLLIFVSFLKKTFLFIFPFIFSFDGSFLLIGFSFDNEQDCIDLFTVHTQWGRSNFTLTFLLLFTNTLCHHICKKISTKKERKKERKKLKWCMCINRFLHLLANKLKTILCIKIIYLLQIRPEI